MFTRVLTLLTLVLMSSVTLADELTPQEVYNQHKNTWAPGYKRAYEIYLKKFNTLESEYLRTGRILSEANSKITSSQKTLDQAKKRLETLKGEQTSPKRLRSVDSIITDIQKLNGEIEKMQADLIRQNSNLTGEQEAFDAAKTALNALEPFRSQSKQEKDVANTRMVIHNQTQSILGLQDDFKKLKTTMKVGESLGDLKDLELEISALESKYDKGPLGIYMQEKIGQLLNSKVFCKTARKRCGVAEPFPISPEEIKTEIFPEVQNHSSEYWNKVKSRRGTK